LISIICCWSISATLHTTVMIEFVLFTASWMLNNLQSIAQKNRWQLLDPPETDPVQYICNHPWIQTHSKHYRVDVLYPQMRFVYFRLTQQIQSRISSLRNEVQEHLKSTLLSRLKVSDLTPHAYSILRPILTSCYSLSTHDPTPGIDPTLGTPLNLECPLRITLQTIDFALFNAYFLLSECLESVAASTHSVIFQTLNF
jgi:hypothetical protein